MNEYTIRREKERKISSQERDQKLKIDGFNSVYGTFRSKEGRLPYLVCSIDQRYTPPTTRVTVNATQEIDLRREALCLFLF